MSFKSRVPSKKVRVILNIDVEITSIDFWDEVQNLDKIYEDNIHNVPESIRDHLVGKIVGDYITDDHTCSWDQIQFTIDDIDSKAEFINL